MSQKRLETARVIEIFEIEIKSESRETNSQHRGRQFCEGRGLSDVGITVLETLSQKEHFDTANSITS